MLSARHRSTAELEKVINGYIKTRNADPKPFDSSASRSVVYRLMALFSVEARLPPDQGIRKIALNKCADRRGARGRRAMVSVIGSLRSYGRSHDGRS